MARKGTQLGKSELKRMIAERLRNPKTNNTHFIRLAELIISIKGGKGRPIIAEEPTPVAATEVAEPDVNELVRKIEAAKAKE